MGRAQQAEEVRRLRLRIAWGRMRPGTVIQKELALTSPVQVQIASIAILRLTTETHTNPRTQSTYPWGYTYPLLAHNVPQILN